MLLLLSLLGPLPTTDAGFMYILTFTDYYTKFVDFYSLKDKTANGVVQRIELSYAGTSSIYLQCQQSAAGTCETGNMVLYFTDGVPPKDFFLIRERVCFTSKNGMSFLFFTLINFNYQINIH